MPADPRTRDLQITNVDSPVARLVADIGAVRVGDSTKEVDTSNERAEDSHVDEGDKASVSGGAVVGE